VLVDPVEVFSVAITSPSLTNMSSCFFRLISTRYPLPAFDLAVGRTPASRAFCVFGPTEPSRPMPAAFCSAKTACWVVPPNLLSALPFQ